MSIICDESQRRTFFFCLENVVIPNYNQCFKLILIHKIRTTSVHVRAQRLVCV